MTSSEPTSALERILRNGALGRVLLGYLGFHIAEYATWVAVLLYAYDATGPASVGVVALVQLLPAAVVAAPAASLGDRYPRERVLTLGYLSQALAMLATAVAMVAALPPPVVYLAAAVAAAALVVTRPTQSALLPSLAGSPAQLTAANSAAGVVEGVGVLVGPLIAAAVVVSWSEGVVFAIAGACLVGSALVTMRLRPVGGLVTVARDEDDPDPSFLAGLRTVLADQDARLVVGLLTVRMVVIGSADVLFVLMAIQLLQMGEPGAGILTAALGAGTIAGGALAFGFIGRSGLAIVAAAGAVAWGIAIVVVGLTGAAAIAPGLIVLGGAGLTIVDVAGRTILQRSVRDGVLARVFGLQEGLAMAGLAVGSVLVSILASAIGLVATTAIVAGILPLVVLGAWPRLSALDRRAVVPIRALRLLRRSALFGSLPGPQLESVARRGTWLSVPADRLLIREGDPGDRYYVLAEGGVRVEQGGRHLRDLDLPGQGFGEIALLRDVLRTASVTTTRDSLLFAVDRAPFLAAITGHPDAFAAADREVDRRTGTAMRADAALVDASAANPDNLTRN